MFVYENKISFHINFVSIKRIRLYFCKKNSKNIKKVKRLHVKGNIPKNFFTRFRNYVVQIKN